MSNHIDLLKPDFGTTRKQLYPFIIQIGVGGTGGPLVQHIAQMLSIFKQRGHYLIADPDLVEAKNLKNQLFVERDIGQKKADVLARRYRAAYNIGISSFSESYIEDVSSLKGLFNTDYQQIGYSREVLYLPVIIGCVDNNYSRQIFHQFFEEAGRVLYIDVGNESVNVPNDFPNRPMKDWEDKEKEAYQNSGWSGQIVCGLKLNGETLLSPTGEVFPDILEDKDEIAPSQIACSELVASDPQRLLTNRMAAMGVSTYLNQLFENGTISNHITFFHAKKGYMKSQPV
ncbi:ThiF family adenylyltransferase [Aquibacillus sp. 3ASR75-11]|uniref:ThiF family adenylyltransferase n=1 Tax=Terrihalobacillus insolitus TaxID=2950438 RepID=A0A9X4ALI5_9BACI|nr:ThiF family adenylyltransferase [Terrihalobacillus insolitus]MDC3424286.1 ThiF family adenylyltransferase [Terrihalobacillus insolitus]